MSTAMLFNKRNLAVLIVLLMLVGYFVYKSFHAERPASVLPDSARMQVRIERFDSLLYANRAQLSPELLANWHHQYADFLELYVEELVGISSYQDPTLHLQLMTFLSDPYIDTLFTDVQMIFSNLTPFENQLSEAYSNYYRLFPEAPFYRPIAFVSGFQYKHALSDSGLLLGLDLHLGSSYRFYPKVQFLTQYMLPRLNSNYLVADGMRLMIEDVLPELAEDVNVLSEMVAAGKTAFLLQTIMPHLPDSLVMRYTSKQMAWALKNELSIWEYLVNENLLFNNDVRQISRLLNDGPFTNGLPADSPPRIAIFSGWRLVKRLMDQHPNISHRELLNMPAHEVLKRAKYKGKI
jgi:hypothetical protein